jgi:dTDP-glucose pyrophosphorylase
MTTDITNLCIPPNCSIRQAIACIDQNAKGIVLITDDERHLLGTITDGDVRRGMLAGHNLDEPVSVLLVTKQKSPYPQAVTAQVGTERAELLRLMQERIVYQIPLLDEDERVFDLVTFDELLPNQILPLQAVIMAGGFGSRMRPLTEDLPKPMLPVGGRPLMELTVEKLKQAGIRRVNVTTHYKAEKIVEHFGDGHNFGVELNYVTEDHPLGTAGALGLMKIPEEPLLVINGDILTGVDFKAMLTYHRESQADLTIAVRKFDLNVPYGVIESNGALVHSLVEKPVLSFFVNAGIYLLEPAVLGQIPNGCRIDMTDLIQRLIDMERPVVSFPIREYWLDIGQHLDYQQAQQDIKNGRIVS